MLKPLSICGYAGKLIRTPAGLMPLELLPRFAGGLVNVPSGASIQTLTNAQKLSLPANTPVGTEVMVSDWVAAGLAGPHQRLKSPSATITAVFVSGSGSTAGNGIYLESGTIGGKPSYYLLGGTVDDVIAWATSEWDISHGGDGLYFSTSAVAFPWLASGWTESNGESPPPTAVASITQGELDAGVTIAGAGTSTVPGHGVEVDGSYNVRGNYMGRLFYNRTDKITSAPTTNGFGETVAPLYGSFWRIVSVGSEWWSISDFEEAQCYTPFGAPFVAFPAFPWGTGWSADGDSNSPAPTVTRNDVASEANWEVV